jgi:glycosyltransferase involved in cell wall biosynthesis
VNDASTDDTMKIIQSFQKVKLISHSFNLGYGRSITDGIELSNGEIIVTMDADGQHDPSDLPLMIEPILRNTTDIVIGSRYKGIYFYELSIINRTGEAFIEAILKFFFGQGVKNNQSGYRVFHKKTKNIFKHAKYSGMVFTTELILMSLINKYRILEFPIRLHDRKIGKSRVKRMKFLLNLLSAFFLYFFIAILKKTK